MKKSQASFTARTGRVASKLLLARGTVVYPSPFNSVARSVLGPFLVANEPVAATARSSGSRFSVPHGSCPSVPRFGIRGRGARTAFDAGVSVAALVIAVAFKTVFIPGSIGFFPDAALPLMFVAAAACTGVYTRLRRARSRRKAVRLAVLVLASSVAGLAAGADGSVAALRALLTIPSVVFPRVLLATTYRDAAMVTRITRAQHGPILLIGGAGYIGSLTVELLLPLGYRVRVLDRLITAATRSGRS